MNYWTIKKWDNSEIRIKPTEANLKLIKTKLEAGEGYIYTKADIVSVKDVKSFYESDNPVPMEDHLLADPKPTEPSAVREPIMNGDAVVCHAVKKRVTRRKWDSYYSAHPAYKFLYEDDSHVTIGFRVLAHLLDPNNVELCTPEETRRVLAA